MSAPSRCGAHYTENRVADSHQRLADDQPGGDRDADVLAEALPLESVGGDPQQRTDRVGQDDVEREIEAETDEDPETPDTAGAQDGAEAGAGNVLLDRNVAALDAFDHTGQRAGLRRRVLGLAER